MIITCIWHSITITCAAFLSIFAPVAKSHCRQDDCVICIFEAEHSGGWVLTVVSVEGVEQWTEHTPLWSTSAENDDV